MAMTDGFEPAKAHVVQDVDGNVVAVFTTFENATTWTVNKFSTDGEFLFVKSVEIW